jgi:hypothetical protein
MDAELDLARLTELQEQLGRHISEIVATLVGELDAAVQAITATVEHGELAETALAAHSARNSALMIDARPMLGLLAELEAAARRNDARSALTVHRQLREMWPRLRRRLELAGAAGG